MVDLRLWVESAYQTWPGADGESSSDFVSTLTTEDQFIALVAGSNYRDALSALERGVTLEAVTENLLTSLPEGAHLPFAILQVLHSSHASLIECDAPPLFMARKGRLVLLPVIEEEAHGHLIRRCEFDVRDGDHLAMVSEGYIRAIGWDRRWGWRDVAVSLRRLTQTRCDAEQLAGALMRLAGSWKLEARSSKLEAGNWKLEARSWQGVQRKTQNETMSPVSSFQYPVSVLAMFVRPMRTATVWSGPPPDPPSILPAVARGKEQAMLDKLMAEEDMRIICGDTTAEIAARLLGARLVLEPRPADGWKEVPPISKMIGPDGAEAVALVTEGVVTMGVARDRLAEAKRPRDLAGREDGASRLAYLLLTADKVHFLVGLAVNPAQTTKDGMPLRKVAIEKLVDDLKTRGKIVSVEFF
jgi:hypothetical protein